MPENTAFPAIVVRVVNDRTVVINRGKQDGIRNGQRFIVYHVHSEPEIDPETKENLGYLETVRGTGTATHVQERITTVDSDRRGPRGRRQVIRKSPFGIASEEETIRDLGEILPYEYPKIGDKVKPI